MFIAFLRLNAGLVTSRITVVITYHHEWDLGVALVFVQCITTILFQITLRIVHIYYM